MRATCVSGRNRPVAVCASRTSTGIWRTTASCSGAQRSSRGRTARASRAKSAAMIGSPSKLTLAKLTRSPRMWDNIARSKPTARHASRGAAETSRATESKLDSRVIAR